MASITNQISEPKEIMMNQVIHIPHIKGTKSISPSKRFEHITPARKKVITITPQKINVSIKPIL